MKSKNLVLICLSALLVLAAGCGMPTEKAVSSGTGSAAESVSSASQSYLPVRTASSSNSTPDLSASSHPSKSPTPIYSAFAEIGKNGLTDNHIYTFANGSVNAAQGDYLLMLNGEFSDADVIIKNDRALVPVNVIQQACGADVNLGYQADNGSIFPYGSDSGFSNMPLIIKIHKADKNIDIMMTVGQAKADVNGKRKALDTPPVIENNTAYVPLRFVCDCFGKVIGSLPAGQDVGDPKSAKSLAFNPIVWVDNYATKPTDSTLTWLKTQMNQALTSLKNHRGTVLKDTDPNDPAFAQIANDINHTYYVGNVGRYALYQGPYPTLVDVNSKTIYFYTVGSGSGWRIWKANMNDPETFMLYYFAG